jgi:hypothetical protein
MEELNVTEQKKVTENIGLLAQVYKESRAMAEYALANGLQVPSAAISLLEQMEDFQRFRKDRAPTSGVPHIEALVEVHATLSRIISPAKPRTIVLLDEENKAGGPLRFLGPVSLIRQLMIAALICLALFVGLVLSPSVNAYAGNILKDDGVPLLLNLMFYLSAAGLGASFSALYKANYYITQGTFDPTYHASYWIRFFLGLIAGLLLSVLISDQVFNATEMQQGLLEPGIIRPLLAILGGFSADVAYTVLNRLVETLESLFRGSTKDQINNQVKDEKGKLVTAQTQQQMKLVTGLANLQQQLTQSGKADQATTVSDLLNELFPYNDFEIKHTAPRNNTASEKAAPETVEQD